MSSSTFRSVLAASLLLSACAQGGPGTTKSPVSPGTVTVTAVSMPSTASSEPTGHAHALVIQATSCWLGGLWSDAVGEKGDARDAGIRRRCDELLRSVGESPEGAYYPLRALDAHTVDAIAERVRMAANGDERDAAHASEVVALLRAVADASRETAHARRAADRVKEVFESFRADERRENKIAAAPELQRAQALRALLDHGGPYARQARVIGTLHAIDRMEIARGLPMHLKVYAVEAAYRDMFGVPAPQLSDAAAAPIRAGTWLAYLTTVASAAGHPVPSSAKKPLLQEALAWNGVLQGFADKLRDVRVDPALDTVSKSVVERIDEQAAAEHAAFETYAPVDR